MDSRKQTYLIVGIAASAMAAAATAFVIISRQRRLSAAAAADTVQELLDRCHLQVRNIESKLGELGAA